MNPPDEITALVADDHPLTLEGVRSILEKAPEIKIVGEALDGNEIKPMIAKLRPRILLMNLVMPNHNPMELGRWVRENYPDTATLVLTGHHRDAYLAGMMQAGAAGYLDKTVQAEQLIASIRLVASGVHLFDEEQKTRARAWHEDVEEKWNRLSEREKQVLRLLVEGASNQEIASNLHIRIKTLDKHLEKIYRKLEVDWRAKAVLWGKENMGDFPY
ncbi:MAG: response regulator transcription factor [Anaerolineales bacterium]|nr:response regulator transcription factor [Anaerolineales bacterium]